MTESFHNAEEKNIHADLSPHELQAIAEQKATAILAKIKEHEEKIKSAKEFAEKATGIKTDWWRLGNTGKKADATATALVKTNEALKEISDLIQESIKLTCTSIQFAQVMHKTMAYMMVNGFKDAGGNIQKLASESREFVQLILSEAEDFVKKQLAVEQKQAAIETWKEQKEKIDEEQSKRLEELLILLNENKKDDEARQQEISLLFNNAKQKDQLDKEQSALIQDLAKQQEFVKIAISLSILSLITSVFAIALPYLR